MRRRFSVLLVVAMAVGAPAWAEGGDTLRGQAHAHGMCASCHSIAADWDGVGKSHSAGVQDKQDGLCLRRVAGSLDQHETSAFRTQSAEPQAGGRYSRLRCDHPDKPALIGS